MRENREYWTKPRDTSPVGEVNMMAISQDQISVREMLSMVRGHNFGSIIQNYVEGELHPLVVGEIRTQGHIYQETDGSYRIMYLHGALEEVYSDSKEIMNASGEIEKHITNLSVSVPLDSAAVGVPNLLVTYKWQRR